MIKVKGEIQIDAVKADLKETNHPREGDQEAEIAAIETGKDLQAGKDQRVIVVNVDVLVTVAEIEIGHVRGVDQEVVGKKSLVIKGSSRRLIPGKEVQAAILLTIEEVLTRDHVGIKKMAQEAEEAFPLVVEEVGKGAGIWKPEEEEMKVDLNKRMNKVLEVVLEEDEGEGEDTL